MPRPAIQDMRNFFENPFSDNDRISDDNMKKFSEEHLGRLTANNPGGALDIILTPLGAAHIAYFGAISSEDVATAVRKGMTKAVDDRIALFKATVKRREPFIHATFIDDEPTYLQFFPQGMTEYTAADKGNIETLMARWETLTQTHADFLGDELHTEFAGLHTGYKNLRTAQIGKKGEVSDDKDTTAAKRDAVEAQLWKNVHYLAWYYNGDVEQCMAYFD